MAITPESRPPPGGRKRQGLKWVIASIRALAAGDLRVAGVFDVVHRVVADLVALGEDPPHRRCAARHLLADLEEGSVDVLLAQHVQEARGVGAGPVVEGERDDLAAPRPVGVEPGGAAGAADLANGSQAEDPIARRRNPVHRAGAARRLTARPALRPPAIAPLLQPSVGGRQRDDQLAGIRSPHPNIHFLLADRLAGGADDVEADLASAAKAQPPPARLPGGAERDAEVVGARPGEVREGVEQGERHRPGGSDRHHEAPPRLGEPGPHQLVTGWIAAAGRPRGHAHREPRDEDDDAQDLA